MGRNANAYIGMLMPYGMKPVVGNDKSRLKFSNVRNFVMKLFWGSENFMRYLCLHIL